VAGRVGATLGDLPAATQGQTPYLWANKFPKPLRVAIIQTRVSETYQAAMFRLPNRKFSGASGSIVARDVRPKSTLS
jgi:hypothetical protein